MNIYPNEKNKIVIFENAPQRHDKLLQKKIISFLKDKYRNLIKERDYNINDFNQKLIKEIKMMNYIILPNYDAFYKKIERLFLKEISDYYNLKKNGLLSKKAIDNIQQQKYEYSLHFSLKK